MTNKNYLGHTARKRFGQNFLVDDYIINSIVSAIAPQKGQNIVEIGPGLGALTMPVCDIVDHLTVVELDRDLATRLRQNPFIQDKITVIEQDALNFDFSTLVLAKDDSNDLIKENYCHRKLRIFGNLPYNISTPLMFHLFKFNHMVEDMHFMLQKEVVNRLCAAKNSKAYGRLSVMTQYFCKVMPVLEVPPQSFRPAPKVESAIVRLIPHQSTPDKQSPYKQCDVARLNQVTSLAFNQRRKTLRNSLQGFFSEQDLLDLNIDPNARAENLAVEDFINLALNMQNKDLNLNLGAKK